MLVPFFPTSPFPGALPVDWLIGTGPSVAAGALYRVEYRIENSEGRVVADSSRRGLEYANVYGDGRDPVMDSWVFGMAAGGVRAIFLPAARLPRTLQGILPSQTNMIVSLHMLQIGPLTRR